MGPSTKKQINIQFKNAISKKYDLLILGNSRTYRGVNPDILSFNTYNFSHDNDSYNQMFYKLKYILNKGKSIKYLILGVDYFQFSFKSDTRNYAYGNWLGIDYLNDYKKSLYSYRMGYLKSNMNPKKLFPLRTDRSKPFLKENGQYIKPGVARKSDSVIRNIKRLNFQVEYFERIVKACKSENIKVFLVMLPVRENELKNYNERELQNFDVFIDRYVNDSNVFYVNYSELKGFSYNDFTDITHLNESAANRFSKQLSKDILRLLKI